MRSSERAINGIRSAVVIPWEKWWARVSVLCLTACAALFGVGSHAAVVTYAVTPLGGSQWEYSYLISNNGTSGSIDEFSIYFAHSLHSNLQLTSSPAGWDFLLVQPDVGLPSAGFVDGLASNLGLQPGDSLSGLTVSFTFLGTGIPGWQPFDVIDPANFEVIESGRTTAESTGAVPEPSTLALLALAGLAAASRRCTQAST